MPKMGLVLQGGGALGAYEYGAVTRLVELGWQPVAVTGVSIGATTAAAIRLVVLPTSCQTACTSFSELDPCNTVLHGGP